MYITNNDQWTMYMAIFSASLSNHILEEIENTALVNSVLTHKFPHDNCHIFKEQGL